MEFNRPIISFPGQQGVNIRLIGDTTCAVRSCFETRAALCHSCNYSFCAEHIGMGHERHIVLPLKEAPKDITTTTAAANKPAIAKTVCTCGAEILPSNMAKHMLSAEHKKRLERKRKADTSSASEGVVIVAEAAAASAGLVAADNDVPAVAAPKRIRTAAGEPDAESNDLAAMAAGADAIGDDEVVPPVVLAAVSSSDARHTLKFIDALTQANYDCTWPPEYYDAGIRNAASVILGYPIPTDQNVESALTLERLAGATGEFLQRAITILGPDGVSILAVSPFVDSLQAPIRICVLSTSNSSGLSFCVPIDHVAKPASNIDSQGAVVIGSKKRGRSITSGIGVGDVALISDEAQSAAINGAASAQLTSMSAVDRVNSVVDAAIEALAALPLAIKLTNRLRQIIVSYTEGSSADCRSTDLSDSIRRELAAWPKKCVVSVLQAFGVDCSTYFINGKMNGDAFNAMCECASAVFAAIVVS